VSQRKIKQERRRLRRSQAAPEPPAQKSRRRRWIGFGAVAILVVAGVLIVIEATRGALPVAGFRVINTYPHDPSAYCQGLIFEDGWLYEGTGKEGQSELRRVELETGKVVQSVALAERFFGEGITAFGDRIYQLTWKHGVGFIYERKSLKKLREFRYRGQGWGLTHDGKRLILSDGTPTLRYLDPESLEEIGRLRVTARGRPVHHLNELEFVNGEILANVFPTDFIARISPADGRVLGWVDLRGLLPPRDRTPETEMLNGTAHDAKGARLFVTGKNWPKLFEIAIVEP
jgi:glutamine cyclotransferase